MLLQMNRRVKFHFRRKQITCYRIKTPSGTEMPLSTFPGDRVEDGVHRNNFVIKIAL